MSFDTNKTWFYQLLGRNLQLYQYVQTANTDTLAGFRIKLPADYYANQLIYPNEDITDGLRIEYTSLDEPFIAEALEDIQVFADGTDISFSTTVITGAGTGDGFASGDKIRVIGSASNDGDYTTTGAASNTLTDSTTPFTAESAGESITLRGQTINYNDIVQDKRFYSFPSDMAKLRDIRVKGHLNDDAEYRSISRIIYEPNIEDSDGI